MELVRELITTEALPSASVLLLRDGDYGLEVFLLKRHTNSDVLGGAYVFPGGKVDAADVHWAARGDLSPDRQHALLAEPGLSAEQAGALFVAAIREVFEEAGVLFADVEPARVRELWPGLRAGRSFAELLEPFGARLAPSLLQPWSRWVTPTRPSLGRKRFDTRFFVAPVPSGQEPTHDAHEATESTWLTPRTALRQYWDRQIDLAPPQILSLAHLARHASVASVLDEARRVPPPCIRPHPLELDGRRVVCYPGDPLHPEPRQLLPGPTRLVWADGHFETEAGLGILLGE